MHAAYAGKTQRQCGGGIEGGGFKDLRGFAIPATLLWSTDFPIHSSQYCMIEISITVFLNDS
jgi:hypothetical protein